MHPDPSASEDEGRVVDLVRALALVFRLGRQEPDVWVTRSVRMVAQIAAELEKIPGETFAIEAAIMLRARDAHFRPQLGALADRRVSLG